MTTSRDRFFRIGLRSMSVVHRALYRLTGGRLVGRVWNLSILLLTTTGRKTGASRTTPLCYFEDGDDLVVVASNGGRDWYPDWWLNLLSDPRATVEIGRTHRRVVARTADTEERARLWAALTAVAPGYLEYERRTSREIPLGLLRPE
jgi:deazaflavin-dependent oxidoreductase (nitroreductase family)